MTPQPSISFLISLGLILAAIGPRSKPAHADLLPPPTPFATTSPDFFAFGDVRGEIEPCGCDPLTDLGGFRRIAKIASTFPRTDILSLGNNFPVNANRFKEDLINESLGIIRPKAVLLNLIELKMIGSKRFIDLSRVAYVLSNSGKSLQRAARPTIGLHSSQIYGYVSPTEGLDLQPYEKIKSEWTKAIKKSKKYHILLFSGSDRDLTQIKGDKLFDLIISSSTKSLTSTPTQDEKEKPGLLLRQPDVYMVPSFGQGMLLGGSIKTRLGDNKLSTIFGDRKKETTKPKNELFFNEQLFLWLTKDYEDNKSLEKTFKKYNETIARSYKKTAEQRKADLKTTNFAGAKACQKCHASSYAAWEKSAHAHAFATLKQKSKHQDPECVSCHVLGLEEKGGFVSETVTPQFANVQCETCHGPRKDHVTNPSLKPDHATPAQDVCVSCHHQPHSAKFLFDVYWPKIKHGRDP